ncbi:MAG: hypothetical protein JWO03_906 [Bacteroidetes bacterium]|nr:hypothetical protein [Bacteroidota bacterium]
MPISVLSDKSKVTYKDATHMYAVDGCFHIADGPAENHGKNTIYAIVTAATSCIIQNDDATNKLPKFLDPVESVIHMLFNSVLRLEITHARLAKLKQILNDYNTKTQKWKQ